MSSEGRCTQPHPYSFQPNPSLEGNGGWDVEARGLREGGGWWWWGGGGVSYVSGL